jgi:peptidoglycan/LPS O-acetylase OafA/YrhL
MNRTQKVPTLPYRADIDGLRAVAVLLVLVYHVRLSAGRFFASGGFVGVDVFFVISGFLISSVILADISASQFSLFAFYERRIRRIIPALSVMMLVTCFLAYRYLLPTELVDYAKSLLAATFSLSNIYYWRQSGYFDAPAAMKPLLHTWSLAVEEQFYIFFPLFLVFVHKLFPRRLRPFIFTVAIFSFIMSAVGALRYPVSTFYLAPTRAWELLLGTILSLDVLPKIVGPLWRNIASASGLVLILIASFLYTTETPFPGVAALLPCLGAALIIAAGQTGPSIVSRALSFKPLVFTGLISYSLYLWHWPIIVFHGMGAFVRSGTSDRVSKLLLIALSFLVATASWKFVEIPFRSGRFKLKGVLAFKTAGIAAVSLAVMAVGLLWAKGIPSRFPVDAVTVASYLDHGGTNYYRDGSCFLSSGYAFQDFNYATCLREDSSKKNYMLLGDSHAAHLWYGLSTTLDGVNVMQANASGCRPTVEQTMAAEDRCRLLMNYIFSRFIPTHHVDALLLSGRWKAEDIPRLSSTIIWANERKIPIILFGPMLQYDSPLPRLLATSMKNKAPAMPFDHRIAEYQRMDGVLMKLAREEWKVRYISFFETLCGTSSCIEYAADDVPLQFDSSHLTKDGSVLVARRLEENRELP